MTMSEHLTAASKHLWAIYDATAGLDDFRAVSAIRGELDNLLSSLETLDVVVSKHGN